MILDSINYQINKQAVGILKIKIVIDFWIMFDHRFPFLLSILFCIHKFIFKDSGIYSSESKVL